MKRKTVKELQSEITFLEEVLINEQQKLRDCQKHLEGAKKELNFIKLQHSADEKFIYKLLHPNF